MHLKKRNGRARSDCTWSGGAVDESSPSVTEVLLQQLFEIVLTSTTNTTTSSSTWLTAASHRCPQDDPDEVEDDAQDDEGMVGRPPVADAETLAKRK